MRRNYFWIVAIHIIGGFFVLGRAVFAASSDILINEIGAYEPSGHEWVEIWNKGQEAVDLYGWKFWENNVNHGLNVSTTDNYVGSNEYAVICQDSDRFLLDYPGFSGSIFDSSWGSLNESGEEIGLKDAEGNFIEKFTYVAAPNYSLERKNPFIAVYDATNWQEHASGNSVGSINSNYSVGQAETTTPPVTPPDGEPTTTPPAEEPPTSTPVVDNSAIWAQIKINEFVSDPQSGNEWVELFNPSTSSLDLVGGLICDSRETTSTCKNLSGAISSMSWLFFDLLSDSYLNNDGDSVILKDKNGITIDRVDYSGASAARKSESLARRADGIDTDNMNDWAITTSLTPGASNIVTARVTAPSGGGGSSQPPVVSPVLPASGATSSNAMVSSSIQSIKLNEIYPNPPGSDSYEEFIEIINSSTESVDIGGWKLSDTSKSFSLSGVINAGQILVFKRPITGIALNNSTKEEVRLLDSLGALVDAVSYDRALEGESYARDKSGQWQWTDAPTPGMDNEFSSAQTGGIIWKVKVPSDGEVGEVLVFDAEDSADERGGDLNFIWNFSDGMILPGGEVERAFSTSGEFAVTVNASSTSGSTGVKKTFVNIGSGSPSANVQVAISEVLPNPQDDEQKEFIELYNLGAQAADLSGWSLKIKNGKNYELPENAVVYPGNYLVFYRTVTKFALNNSGDQVALLNRSGQAIDLVKFGKGTEGASYALSQGEWFWTDEPTPGTANFISTDSLIVGKATTKKSSAKKLYYQPMSIAEARDMDAGSEVIVKGAVEVLPGVFGSQYFYIEENNMGIQIYSFKKDFPALKVGDNIKVSGVISEPGGIKRIKVTGGKSIGILASDPAPEAAAVDPADSLENYLGGLIKISGEITELKSNYIYLDNGSEEFKVYFKKGANIDKKKFKVGMSIEIVGVLEASGTEYELWPRATEDITVVNENETAANVKSENNSNSNNNSAREVAVKYLTATAGGLTALLLGLFGRTKVFVLKDGAKKLAGLAVRLFKRG